MPEEIPRSTQLTDEELAAEEQFASAIEADVEGKGHGKNKPSQLP